MNINKVMLTGNITRDVEVRKTQDGISVATVTLAVNGRDSAQFFDCVLWKETAENAERFLTKGSKVGVVGHLAERKYTKKDGTKNRTVEVIVEQMEYLSQRQKDEPQTFQQLDDENADDLPF